MRRRQLSRVMLSNMVGRGGSTRRRRTLAGRTPLTVSASTRARSSISPFFLLCMKSPHGLGQSWFELQQVVGRHLVLFTLHEEVVGDRQGKPVDFLVDLEVEVLE